MNYTNTLMYNLLIDVQKASTKSKKVQKGASTTIGTPTLFYLISFNISLMRFIQLYISPEVAP